MVKGIVGGNAENYGEIRFGEEGITVVYHGDTHGRVQGRIIIYISNR